MAARDRVPLRTDPTAGRGEQAVGDPTDPRMTAPAHAPIGGGAARFADLPAPLIVIAGIWLIIAPFVLAYASADPVWNDVVFGAVSVVLGLAAMAFKRERVWLSGLVLLTGAWVFISAFWLDSSSTAQVNDLILGAILFILGLAQLPSRAPAMGRR